MTFVNPQILQRIMGGVQGGAQHLGQTINGATPEQQQAMIAMLAGVGAGMTQAAGQPGAGFAQAMGGGAQGMMQGQQQGQQSQMNQLQMQRAQQEMERQERISKILGDILGGTGGQKGDWASQVDAQLPQTPQLGQPGPAQVQPLPQGPAPQATRFSGAPGRQWDAILPELKSRVIQQESGGRQFAADGGPLTSSAGALGKMQIMPGTGPDAAELAGLPWDPERLKTDEAYNEALGTAYLNHLGGIYNGDPVLASAAYNWGMGRVNSHIDRVGDPRKGEVSHEEWVAAIPVDEARNYAAKVGMPLLGGQGQPAVQQPQQAPQAMQQPQNSYQQPQQGGGGGDMSIPPMAAQLLSTMDPDSAVKALWEMQKPVKPGELPAEVRGLLWAFDGDEQAARQAWHEQQAAKGQPTPGRRERKIADYQQLYGVDRNQAVAMTDGLIKPIYNEQLGRTVLMDFRDPMNPQVREVEIAPASEPSDPERPERTMFEIARDGNIAGLVPSVAESVGGITGQMGLLTDRQREAAEQRQTFLLNNRGLIRALQDSPMYAQREREAIEREVGINPRAFDSEDQLIARMTAVHDVLQRRLAEAKRIEGDPRMGDAIRRQAQRSARDIEAYLLQMGDPSGAQQGTAPPEPSSPAPEGVDAELWRYMTDEERALWLN